jgi:hypothetical protein
MPIYIPNTFDSVGEAVVDGAGGGFFLDQYPGANAAYSVARKLSSTYTGFAFRAYRYANAATQDIGFDSNNEIDAAALVAFGGVSNCGISIIYDQTGNGNDLTAQVSAWGQIYLASTGITLKNGKPIFSNFLTGIGSGFFEKASVSFNTDWWFFVGEPKNQASTWFISLDSDNNPSISQGGSSSGPASLTPSNSILYGNGLLNGQNLIIGTGNHVVFSWNVSMATYTAPSIRFPARYAVNTNTGVAELQEMYFYDTDQSANRAAIEVALNNYFQVYIPYTYDLQEFDTTGTWVKPANCLMAEVVIVGAGGGGASGSKQAGGSTSQGGSAGAGGAVMYNAFLASSLGATESVTIGVAGSGGAAATQNNSNGTTGGAGGTSSFGSHCVLPGGAAATYALPGAPFGPWSAGVVKEGSGYVNGAGGRISSVAGTGDGFAGGTQTFIANLMESPSGGSIAAASTGGGGNGNRIYSQAVSLNTAAVASAINTGVKSGNGTSNYSANFSVGPIMWGTGNIGTMHYGTSGAAGSASQSPTNGADAGDSGNYGQGGAGGGACQNGASIVSGKGGNGGGACIKVLSVCYPS